MKTYRTIALVIAASPMFAVWACASGDDDLGPSSVSRDTTADPEPEPDPGGPAQRPWTPSGRGPGRSGADARDLGAGAEGDRDPSGERSASTDPAEDPGCRDDECFAECANKGVLGMCLAGECHCDERDDPPMPGQGSDGLTALDAGLLSVDAALPDLASLPPAPSVEAPPPPALDTGSLGSGGGSTGRADGGAPAPRVAGNAVAPRPSATTAPARTTGPRATEPAARAIAPRPRATGGEDPAAPPPDLGLRAPGGGTSPDGDARGADAGAPRALR